MVMLTLEDRSIMIVRNRFKAVFISITILIYILLATTVYCQDDYYDDEDDYVEIAAPLSIRHEFKRGTLYLSWRKTKGAAYYDIYRAEGIAMDFTLVGSEGKNSFTDPAIKEDKDAGKYFYYKIVAKSVNYESSPDSAVHTVFVRPIIEKVEKAMTDFEKDFPMVAGNNLLIMVKPVARAQEYLIYENDKLIARKEHTPWFILPAPKKLDVFKYSVAVIKNDKEYPRSKEHFPRPRRNDYDTARQMNRIQELIAALSHPHGSKTKFEHWQKIDKTAFPLPWGNKRGKVSCTPCHSSGSSKSIHDAIVWTGAQIGKPMIAPMMEVVKAKSKTKDAPPELFKLLKVLTGKSFGSDYDKWLEWWKTQGY